MTKLEQSYVIREVLKNTMIENSSDFIAAAYSLNYAFCEPVAKRMEPILFMETSISHDGDWAANAVEAQALMSGNTLAEYKQCQDAYRTVLDFLLLDDTVGKVFRMDDTDHIGWRIWRELDAKYKWAKKMIEIKTYREQRQWTIPLTLACFWARRL